MKIDIKSMTDGQLGRLVDNRWNSSAEVWSVVDKIYGENTRIYENKASWLQDLPVKHNKIQANRIFTNMESVINSLIANPPQMNMIPSTNSEESKKFALSMESYFRKKYGDLNVKETMRMGLRNIYFGRLAVLKPFWNHKLNDFDIKSVDPRKVRFSKNAKNEEESEFAIEEVDDDLVSVIARFPNKKEELMKENGITEESELFISNPDITYKEAWVNDWVIFKYKNIILDKIKNPNWDWDGLLITGEEEQEIQKLIGDDRRFLFDNIRAEQDTRKEQKTASQLAQASLGEDEEDGEFYVGDDLGTEISYKEYFFNYFDTPRKPYIFATILNNENKPIGRTDMIQLSKELQQSIDKRKMDIGENADLANGQIKVDSSVMGKNDAQKLRFEAKGIIYGKDVVNGVVRETGAPLPSIVFDDMLDSRAEIDNIMAASSAFRGEREGSETKGGRLALIEQSFLRLNELVQVVDYLYENTFSWFYQLAKINYTEPHYAKWIGRDNAQQNLELIQDDFEEGSEVRIIAGKSLPEDNVFKFQQAQEDVQQGYISPTDYLRIARYDNPNELSRNAVLFAQNPASAVGLKEDETPLPSQPGELTPEQSTQMMQAQSGLPIESEQPVDNTLI